MGLCVKCFIPPYSLSVNSDGVVLSVVCAYLCSQNVKMLLDLCPQNFSSGVVPYLGTYLTVLTMLDTALTDTVNVSTHHINPPVVSV